MSFIKRNSQVAMKIETTSGTAEALTAAEGTMNVHNLQISNAFSNFTQRPLQGSSGFLAGVAGARAVRISFDIFLAGKGAATVPQYAIVLFQACGMAYDASNYWFFPESTFASQKTASIGVYENGVLKLARGCAGSFRINAVHGEPAVISFDMTGVFDGISDTNNLVITHETVIPPRVAAATMTLGAWTPIISTFTLDSGNDVQLQQTVGNTEAYIRAFVASRQITGTLDAEQKLVATKDVMADYLASTEAALTFSYGTVQYNKIAITCPKAQISDVQYGERNGLITTNLNYQANTDSAAGFDNELKIAFSQV